MNHVSATRKLGVVLMLALGAGAGCESTDGGATTSTSVYYGVGFYDPWYHGAYYYPPSVIVTPPPGGGAPPPSPSHPIAKPPAPRPTPMPSIPSRPMPRAR